MSSKQVLSTLGSIVPHNFARLHNRSCCRNRTIILNASRFLVVSKQNISHFPGYQSLRFLSAGMGEQNKTKMKMNMVVDSSVQPGPPLPSDSSPGSWKFWILGMLISAVLPFLTNKWGPLLKLKNEIETAVDTVEHVAEIVDNVAEEVEKVAEEVADHLPDGGKLKNAVTFVENVAKEVDKDADLVEEVIDKIEEAEKVVESFIEPVATDQAKKDN